MEPVTSFRSRSATLIPRPDWWASDFEVNGIAATSFTQMSATSITFTFATSPVSSNQLAQTMTIAAGAIDRTTDGSSADGLLRHVQ